ncbi:MULTISPECIES: hypothetical protein [unclassified Vibrio]|uniref:hypothetical protein n=1 Tax=unclassified Vibrio TaxID=2614977 RepID=UPI000B8EA62A|nr:MULTISPECIES: hypothetical protein [unclassified Vibrio]NAW92315.1 hypothetical protein [Vibrio sp. V24_P1S3T111]OXX20875.1 hypothetical protein B9J86_11920 [Vibrio sp. V06_P1A73T115]OXX21355.1 hypothetical protein B9J88_11905 [Vibrio sp. V05_P4A8T149]OXX30788.1 hypothetical protein B9J81_15260 [Vibrio sp. V04_P4A5T148]OXX33183.1 hypothetical protein B9J95_05950 [Vibrio sp. V14_P6S14T42]
MRINRRRWNNILILAVIAFIAILNLPTVIKTYLIEPPASPYSYVINPNAQLQALHFTDWSLELNQNRWRSSKAISVAPEILAQRWQSLVGTEVDDATYESLASLLRNPQTVEVWYQDREEPQRITYYQTPQFWLLKNWQEKWVALSVEEAFLFPN